MYALSGCKGLQAVDMLQQVKHLVTASQTNEGQKRATCPATLPQNDLK